MSSMDDFEAETTVETVTNPYQPTAYSTLYWVARS